MKHHLWYCEKIAHKNYESNARHQLLEPVCVGAVAWYICGIAGALLLVFT